MPTKLKIHALFRECQQTSLTDFVRSAKKIPPFPFLFVLNGQCFFVQLEHVYVNLTDFK